MENQQLRRSVIALVQAVSDKAIAASPALWTLRDQVVRLEQVQVLAERLEAAKPSTAAAVTPPKAWLAGRGSPENARLHAHEVGMEKVEQAMEQDFWNGLSWTKQGLVYAAVPLVHLMVIAAIFHPSIDISPGIFLHDTQRLILALHPH